MLPWITTLIARLLRFSYRYRYHNIENRDRAIQMSSSGAYIYGTWHQHALSGILGERRTAHVCMVSRSKDGEFIAHLLHNLGHRSVRGSSRRGGVDKGGKDAKEKMIDEIKNGIPAAITIDGPKGPAKEVKPGIVSVSSLTQSPILPYLAIPEKFIQFKSWDQFRLALPFSKIHVYFGSPVMAPHELQKEDFKTIQQKVKHELSLIEQSSLNP